MITQNDKNYSSIIHLSSFAGWFFPFGNVIAPLILWFAKKDESAFIDAHGKAIINFQISIMLYVFLLALLIIPITFLTLGLGLVAILLAAIPIVILKIILIISASINAGKGAYYNYPFSINFLK